MTSRCVIRDNIAYIAIKMFGIGTYSYNPNAYLGHTLEILSEAILVSSQNTFSW